MTISESQRSRPMALRDFIAGTRDGEDQHPRATITAHRALLSSITRADVLDLATDANDARQRAILFPHTAEEELARAARLEDLATRLSTFTETES